MFPHGAPGFALLLLRISVAAMLLVNCCGLSSSRLVFAGVLLISIALAIGFVTPYLSVIAVGLAVANLVSGHVGAQWYALSIMDAVVLAILGPGAYSIDARLFGRSVTVVPPRKDTRR